MYRFFISLFSPDGEVSSKRFVTFCAFFSLTVAFFCNLLFGLKVDVHLQECMEWIVITGLGFTASERFSKSSNGVN